MCSFWVLVTSVCWLAPRTRIRHKLKIFNTILAPMKTSCSAVKSPEGGKVFLSLFFPRTSILFGPTGALCWLFEAAGATCLPVRVELWRDGVWHHAFQDVVLCGHDVLDQEVCSFRDVQIVLKVRDELQLALAQQQHLKYLVLSCLIFIKLLLKLAVTSYILTVYNNWVWLRWTLKSKVQVFF